MKRKWVWLMLSCLMVAALALASCKPAVEEEPEELPAVEEVAEEEVVSVPEKKVEVAVAEAAEMVRDSLGVLKEKPRYGGTGRFSWVGTDTMGTWDLAAPIPGRSWHFAMYNTLTKIDFSKGPSGTGELAFTIEFIPEKYRVGSLAESFEQLDLTTVVYHLRQGVRYHNKPPANGREMVADDVVFAVDRAQSHPRSAIYRPPGTPPEDYIRATALDRYTVEFKLPKPDTRGFTETNFAPYPPEVIDEFGDLEDWRNAIGTGPFICVDYVPDSSLTYVKFEGYWDRDVFFPENKVPYWDGYTVINVPDQVTALAALRTGKIDWLTGIKWEDAESLQETHPGMSYSPSYEYYNRVIEMRNDLEPFSDIRVRKALAIAIDRKGIVRDLYKGNAEVLAWPFSPYLANMNIYTPLEEQPPENQELFEYDPEKAKQLLAEAGYPDGFKTELLVSSVTSHVDVAQIVKMFWDAIGVETTVNVMEVGTFYSRMFSWRYEQTALTHWPSTNPFSIFDYAYHAGKMYNYSKVSDPWVVEVSETVQREADPAERERIFKEAGVRALGQVYNIGMPVSYNYVFWWPWVKGYNGEWHSGFTSRWLDVELKKEMTGRK